MSEDPAEALAQVWRADWGRLLGLLVRQFQRLDLAEEGLSAAFERAAARWPADGVPANRPAWLLTVARRRITDLLRAEAMALRKLPLLAVATTTTEPDVAERAGDLPGRDDVLPMVFGICHPALGVEAQAALALRLVLGIPTAEIARLFLVPEPTMAARLTRARRKLVLAGVPFRIPEVSELDVRIEGVLRAIYLAFTAGYAPGDGDEPLRAELAGEAVRLAQLLNALLPGRTDVRALLALLLLTHARRDARVAGRELILLAEQNRTRWRHAEIAAGLELVVSLESTTGYSEELRLQALIAGLHAGAASAADTNWAMISSLYERLAELTGSPVVRLNQAVAVAESAGAEAGLALLAEVAPGDVRSHRLAGVRAELHLRAGRPGVAAALFDEAVGACTNEAERRRLVARRQQLSAEA